VLVAVSYYELMKLQFKSAKLGLGLSLVIGSTWLAMSEGQDIRLVVAVGIMVGSTSLALISPWR